MPQAVPYIVMAAVSAGSMAYTHNASLSARRKSARAERERKDNAVSPLDVSFSPYAAATEVMGRTMIGGTPVYSETSGPDGKGVYANYIQAVCNGEINGFESIYFGNQLVRGANGDSNFQSMSLVDVYSQNGGVNQVADANFVSRANEGYTSSLLDNNFRGRGVAWVGVSLKQDVDVFGGQIPTITSVVQGPSIFDPRTNTYVYTSNPILHVMNVMNKLVGIPYDRFDMDSGSVDAIEECDVEIASSDIWASVGSNQISGSVGTKIHFIENETSMCDQQWVGYDIVGTNIPDGTTIVAVSAGDLKSTTTRRYNGMQGSSFTTTVTGENSITLSSSPTGPVTGFNVLKKSVRKYTANGSYRWDEAPSDIIERLLMISGAKRIYVNGKYKFRKAWRTPAFTVDESWLVEKGLVVNVRDSSFGTRYNCAHGIYKSAQNFWNDTECTPIHVQEYIDEDGVQSIMELNLPYTDTPLEAYRIIKRELLDSRYNTTVTMQCNRKGYQLEPTDIIRIDNELLGWDSSVPHYFIVTSTSELDSGVIEISLKHTAEEIFNINATIADIVLPTTTRTKTPSNRVDEPDALNVQFEDNDIIISWENALAIPYASVSLRIYDVLNNEYVENVVLGGNTTSYRTKCPTVRNFTVTAFNTTIDGRNSPAAYIAIDLSVDPVQNLLAYGDVCTYNDGTIFNTLKLWGEWEQTSSYKNAVAVKIDSDGTIVHNNEYAASSFGVQLVLPEYITSSIYNLHVANVGISGLYSTWTSASFSMSFVDSDMATGSLIVNTINNNINNLILNNARLSASLSAVDVRFNQMSRTVASVIKRDLDTAGDIARVQLEASESFTLVSSSLYQFASSSQAAISASNIMIVGVSSSLGDVITSVQNNYNLFATSSASFVQTTNTLAASIGTSSAVINTLSDAYIDATGSVITRWGVNLDSNGVVTGIQAVAQNGPISSSAVRIYADNFQVRSSVSGSDITPFEVVGGVTKIKDAVIGTVSADKISAGTIKASNLSVSGSCSISSTGYNGTDTGWEITGDGNLTCVNGVFKGLLKASIIQNDSLIINPDNSGSTAPINCQVLTNWNDPPYNEYEEENIYTINTDPFGLCSTIGWGYSNGFASNKFCKADTAFTFNVDVGMVAEQDAGYDAQYATPAPAFFQLVYTADGGANWSNLGEPIFSSRIRYGWYTPYNVNLNFTVPWAGLSGNEMITFGMRSYLSIYYAKYVRARLSWSNI